MAWPSSRPSQLVRLEIYHGQTLQHEDADDGIPCLTIKKFQISILSTILITYFRLTLSGVYLLARVKQGQCRAGVTIFESQECNPVASAGSIPHDQVRTSYAYHLIDISYVGPSTVKCTCSLSRST